MLFYAADAPTAADWLEAIATAVGAVFSILAFLIAFFVLRRDHRTRGEDKVEAEAAQARMIYAEADTALGSRSEGWTGAHIVVHNNSKGRVTLVRVRVGTATFLQASLETPMSSIPGDQSDGRELLFNAPVAWPWKTEEVSRIDLMRQTSIVVKFADSEGRPWSRIGRQDPVAGRIQLHLPNAWWMLAEYVRLLPAIRRIGRFFQQGPSKLSNWLEQRLAERHKDDFYDPA